MKEIMQYLPHQLRHHDLMKPITIISILSCLGLLIHWIFPLFYIYGGIYSYPVGIGGFLVELVFYSFLHATPWHLLSNVVFFLIIGKTVEYIKGSRYTWYLWGWTTLFVGLFLLRFSDNPTIGGSGFAMSLLVVYAWDFYRTKQYEDFKGAILLLIINLLIGFDGRVSFLGHFAGLVAGILFIWYHEYGNRLARRALRTIRGFIARS